MFRRSDANYRIADSPHQISKAPKLETGMERGVCHARRKAPKKHNPLPERWSWGGRASNLEGIFLPGRTATDERLLLAMFTTM